MRAFVFALQPLLAASERREDERRQELALATHVAGGERERYRSAHEALVRAGKGTASAMRSSPEDLREALARRDLFERAARSSDVSLSQCEERAAVAREAFAAARLERRRLEALRDRARSAYEAERERRETVALEDANAAAHNAVTLFASSFHN